MAPCEALGGLGPRQVGNLLCDHRAIQIVGAIVEANLGEPFGDHDPVGFDMGNVVEHEACDCDFPEVLGPGGFRNVVGAAQFVVFVLVGQRDVGEEPMGAVLKLAELAEVVHAVPSLRRKLAPALSSPPKP